MAFAETQKAANCIANAMEEDGYITIARLAARKAFRRRRLPVLVKARSGSDCVRSLAVFVLTFAVAMVFVSISICSGVCRRRLSTPNETNFPHCLWKKSVPVVPLSFLSNRCKTLLRKHLFILFPANIFFPSVLPPPTLSFLKPTFKFFVAVF